MDLVGVISSTGSNVVSRSNTNIDNLCAENRHHHYHYHHHHQQHEHSTTTNNCQPTTATTTTTITSLSRPGHSDRTASHWPKTTDHLTSPNDKPRFHLSLSGESIHSSVSGWIVAWIGKSCFGKKKSHLLEQTRRRECCYALSNSLMNQCISLVVGQLQIPRNHPDPMVERDPRAIRLLWRQKHASGSTPQDKSPESSRCCTTAAGAVPEKWNAESGSGIV